MLSVEKLIKEYGLESKEGWNIPMESLLVKLSELFTKVLDGSGFYGYRNPSKGEKNINISPLGIVGSTKKDRIMWMYPKKTLMNIELGLKREIYQLVSRNLTLPTPREIKPGKYAEEWVIRVDIKTAIQICMVFAGKDYQ